MLEAEAGGSANAGKRGQGPSTPTSCPDGNGLIQRRDPEGQSHTPC